MDVLSQECSVLGQVGQEGVWKFFLFCEVCDAEPVTQSLDSAVQVVSFPFTYGNEPISLPNTKTQDSLAAPLHR